METNKREKYQSQGKYKHSVRCNHRCTSRQKKYHNGKTHQRQTRRYHEYYSYPNEEYSMPVSTWESMRYSSCNIPVENYSATPVPVTTGSTIYSPDRPILITKKNQLPITRDKRGETPFTIPPLSQNSKTRPFFATKDYSRTIIGPWPRVISKEPENKKRYEGSGAKISPCGSDIVVENEVPLGGKRWFSIQRATVESDYSNTNSLKVSQYIHTPLPSPKIANASQSGHASQLFSSRMSSLQMRNRDRESFDSDELLASDSMPDIPRFPPFPPDSVLRPGSWAEPHDYEASINSHSHHPYSLQSRKSFVESKQTSMLPKSHSNHSRMNCRHSFTEPVNFRLGGWKVRDDGNNAQPSTSSTDLGEVKENWDKMTQHIHYRSGGGEDLLVKREREISN